MVFLHFQIPPTTNQYQIMNIEEVREYIKEKQKIQYKFALSHIECDDLLQILDILKEK